MQTFVSPGFLRMPHLGERSMRTWKRMGFAAFGWMIAIGTPAVFPGPGLLAAPAAPVTGARQMPQLIEQYAADRMSLNRIYPLILAPARMDRFEKFDNDKLAMLAAMNFDKLSEDDQIDYLLLKNRLNADLHNYAIQKKQAEEMAAPAAVCEDDRRFSGSQARDEAP